MHTVYVQRPVSEKNSFFYAMVWAPRAVNATFSGDISHPYELTAATASNHAVQYLFHYTPKMMMPGNQHYCPVCGVLRRELPSDITSIRNLSPPLVPSPAVPQSIR